MHVTVREKAETIKVDLGFRERIGKVIKLQLVQPFPDILHRSPVNGFALDQDGL